MTINTEDLRAQFENYVTPVGDLTRCTICPDEYADSTTNDVWLGYQAGHAAGVAAERERCAQVCLELAINWLGDPVLAGMSDGAEGCADAIRGGQGGGA